MTRYGLRQLDQGKLYYSISEICKITDLEPHVLRFWESEFSQLRPKKNRGGVRAYRQKDIQIISYIKFLLYEEKYTISGAKKKLSNATEAEISGQVDMLQSIPEKKQDNQGFENGPEQQSLNLGLETPAADTGQTHTSQPGDNLNQETREKLLELKNELLNLLGKLK